MGSRAVVNIGVQQFDKVREQNAFYIDKTGFIKEWWEGGSDVTLITRPRRFGKTLNMSMVDCFFFQQRRRQGRLVRRACDLEGRTVQAASGHISGSCNGLFKGCGHGQKRGG